MPFCTLKKEYFSTDTRTHNFCLLLFLLLKSNVCPFISTLADLRFQMVECFCVLVVFWIYILLTFTSIGINAWKISEYWSIIINIWFFFFLLYNISLGIRAINRELKRFFWRECSNKRCYMCTLKGTKSMKCMSEDYYITFTL